MDRVRAVKKSHRQHVINIICILILRSDDLGEVVLIPDQTVRSHFREDLGFEEWVGDKWVRRGSRCSRSET
jgi:hypothetical protein